MWFGVGVAPNIAVVVIMIHIVTRCNFPGKQIENEIRAACEAMSHHCSRNNNSATSTSTHIVFFKLVMMRVWESSDENGHHYIPKVSHINVTILDKKKYDSDVHDDYNCLC